MECGECTACCYAFSVIDNSKEAREECEYVNGGCAIYADRPKVCRDYECAWVTQPKVHIDLRPDKCGVIFTKFKNHIIQATMLRKPEPVALLQMQEFGKQGYKIK